MQFLHPSVLYGVQVDGLEYLDRSILKLSEEIVKLEPEVKDWTFSDLVKWMRGTFRDIKVWQTESSFRKSFMQITNEENPTYHVLMFPNSTKTLTAFVASDHFTKRAAHPKDNDHDIIGC